MTTNHELDATFAKLDIEDGDVVVMTSSVDLSFEKAEACRAVVEGTIRRAGKFAPVLILGPGTSIQILKTSRLTEVGG